MPRLLVTGAASVIGRAMLARLDEEEEWRGADVAVLGSAQADFTKAVEVGRLVEEMKRRGPWDGAALVAGLNMDQGIAALPEGTWESVWDINVRAHARLLFALSEAGAFSFGAPLLFVGSIVGLRGNAGQSAYAAAKGALVDLCAAACRLGLRANVLLPPLVDSPLLAKLSPEVKQRLFDSRLLPDPDPAASCAEAAAFLLSRRSAYINNQVFHADSRVTCLGMD